MTATVAAGTTAPSRTPQARSPSVDLIRGAVMMLMAIDHVRVYPGLRAGGPTPAIFFTRWSAARRREAC